MHMNNEKEEDEKKNFTNKKIKTNTDKFTSLVHVD